ncbi:MAG: hypothetical protein ACYS29_08265, partial [Planctomycetota bacterium]
MAKRKKAKKKVAKKKVAKKTARKKRRAQIPEDVEAELLFRNDHRCCMCHEGPAEAKAIQIHHINEDPSDYRLANLAVLCKPDHDRLKDRPWMARGYREAEIKKYKRQWEEAVAERRKHLQFPAATLKERTTERLDSSGAVIERHIEREVSYANGLAPEALKIAPPVVLSTEKERTLERVKKIVATGTGGDRLVQIFSDAKRAPELKRQDKVVLSRLCLSIGDRKYHAKDYSSAEMFYKEALDFARGAKEAKIVRMALCELGASAGMHGRHKEAVGYFTRVLRANERDHDAWFNKSVGLSRL